jgi:hypothetical protein
MKKAYWLLLLSRGRIVGALFPFVPVFHTGIPAATPIENASLDNFALDAEGYLSGLYAN